MDMTQILPQFGGAAFTIIAFVVALSIIVAIHEYGHYIVGRWTGIYAEVFSLGIGPVLFSRADKHGTRWQIAALPFGGYVKFLGDANVASVGATDDAKTERNTMAGAPLWARSATVVAGPLFNFALSILIFATVMVFDGRASDPLTMDEVRALPDSYTMELEQGDEILSIGGQDTPALADFDGFIDSLPIEPTLEYRVLRDGQDITVRAPYPYPAMILALNPQSAAFDIDMKIGDVITAINGAPIFAFSQLQEAVAASEGRPLLATVWRSGEMIDFTLAPRSGDRPMPEGGFETRYRIGVTGGLFFEAQTESVGPVTALWSGVKQVWFIIKSSLSGLWHMITGAISSCNLSGPIGIAQTSGAMASQGASSFIWFVAVLSTAVGLLNLLPVPVLDGGHLMFHAYEAVTGKMPSNTALRILMAVGLSLILSLMVFAIANDLFLCP